MEKGPFGPFFLGEAQPLTWIKADYRYDFENIAIVV
jgi:hypothetical protein